MSETTDVAPKKGKKAAHTAQKPVLLTDVECVECCVEGVDASGRPIALSDCCEITVASSDLKVVTVDAPCGTMFKVHAVKAGKANITVEATTAEEEEFSFTLPVEVSSTALVGINVVPGQGMPH